MFLKEGRDLIPFFVLRLQICSVGPCPCLRGLAALGGPSAWTLGLGLRPAFLEAGGGPAGPGGPRP